LRRSGHLKMSPDQQFAPPFGGANKGFLRIACNTIIRYPIEIGSGHW